MGLLALTYRIFNVCHVSIQAQKEKELGNEAYKKKDFELALKHYGQARELDPSNMTYITNQAGELFYSIVRD